MDSTTLRDLFYFFPQGDQGLELSIVLVRDQLFSQYRTRHYKEELLNEFDLIETIQADFPKQSAYVDALADVALRSEYLGFQPFLSLQDFEKYHAHLRTIYSFCFSDSPAQAMTSYFFVEPSQHTTKEDVFLASSHQATTGKLQTKTSLEREIEEAFAPQKDKGDCCGENYLPW